MAGLNKVFLLGNLTRDPDLRYTTGGTAVCRLGLAVNRRFTTARGEDREEVCFVDIDVWGKQAESCGNYLRKGAPALIEGRLQFDQWEDRETGRKRSRLLVTAERVQFLGSPGRGGDFGDGAGPRAAPPVEGSRQADAAPVEGRTNAGPASPPPAHDPMPPFSPPQAPDEDVPDDIPF